MRTVGHWMPVLGSFWDCLEGAWAPGVDGALPWAGALGWRPLGFLKGLCEAVAERSGRENITYWAHCASHFWYFGFLTTVITISLVSKFLCIVALLQQASPWYTVTHVPFLPLFGKIKHNTWDAVNWPLVFTLWYRKETARAVFHLLSSRSENATGTVSASLIRG